MGNGTDAKRNAGIDEPLDAVTTFVKWKGEVIAYFRAYRLKGERDFTKTKAELMNAHRPEIAYWALQGYVHVGQHGYFDEDILRSARRATEAEYGPLKNELESLFSYVIYPHQRGKLKLKGKWYDNK